MKQIHLNFTRLGGNLFFIKRLLWVRLMGTTPTTKYEKCHEVMDYLYNFGIGELCDINDSKVVKFVDIR
jgi:hypothetical protein